MIFTYWQRLQISKKSAEQMEGSRRALLVECSNVNLNMVESKLVQAAACANLALDSTVCCVAAYFNAFPEPPRPSPSYVVVHYPYHAVNVYFSLWREVIGRRRGPCKQGYVSRTPQPMPLCHAQASSAGRSW